MRILPVLFLFYSTFAWATSVKTATPEQVGEHYPLFTFEKNENPQNIMIIYTKLDEECRFKENPRKTSQPFFDFYWLMDRQRYKPVHPLIKSGIRDRLQLKIPDGYAKDRHQFSVQINDLRQIDKSLQQTSIEISAKKNKDHCEVSTLMNLEPGNPKTAFEVTKIYSESKKTWIPPFRRVIALTLNGVFEDSQKPFEKRFVAKH